VKEKVTAMEYIKANKSFAKGYHFYKMFWVFFLSSIMGCVLETVYCFVRFGHWESRAGVLYGPFSQIYGLAAVLMILVLHRINVKRELYLFIACCIVGASFEFIANLLQEMAFGFVSWNYNNQPYNILGRTSLFYAFIWGILGVFLIKDIYPVMSRFVERIPSKFGIIITWLLLIFMVADLTVSSAATYRAHERYNHIPATTMLQIELDKLYPDSYIKRIYPNMVHVR
jgi:uncharacterized membrane protein